MTKSIITAYYIATVWMAAEEFLDDVGSWSTTRQVVRLQAIGEADFADRVRKLWPDKTITVGPVGKSRIQE